MRSLLAHYASRLMAAATGDAGCARGCSGRGDCLNGTCLCEIRYAGDECSGPNMPYHACVGGVFLAVAGVCALQLLACVVCEYRRLKAPSVLRACRVTTQKMLYLLAGLAALIRGAYFVSPSVFEKSWTTALLSAYYPLLMSGSSLIVCFWAEVFHLRDVRWERPRFLSKSFLGFVTFNAISYSLLLAELLVDSYADVDSVTKTYYQHIFNGCYAALLFIVVIFFLIYGVEVYFKVRGGFLTQTRLCTVATPVRGRAADADGDARATLVTQLGVRTEDAPELSGAGRGAVDQSQLQQSRLGLLSQALMLIVIVCFLASETVSEQWKTRVAVYSRNWHDVVFRLAEIGVALWFPCVLWNCMAPERLWLLNPRRLLSRQLDDARLDDLVCARERSGDSAETASLVGSTGSTSECWICYNTQSPEPLLQPCLCKGDVSRVHRSCLQRWLVESGESGHSGDAAPACKVCLAPYVCTRSASVDWTRGFTATHWARTGCVLALLGAALAAALVGVQLAERVVVRVVCAGGAGLAIVVGVKVLGINTAMALQRAKCSAISISDAPRARDGADAAVAAVAAVAAAQHSELATISSHVTVEMASKEVLEKALRGDKH